VDASGFVLLAHVHAANLHDRGGAGAMVRAAAAAELPRLRLVRADQVYAGAFARRPKAKRDRRVEVAIHPDRQLRRYGPAERPENTFRVLPRRCVVERAFARLGQSRRLVRDYKR
jgi:putative transposase